LELSKSAFQTPITIRDAVDNIHRRMFLLPAIQRELVWETEQIVKLFDSLMREYTIGSFLFWRVEKTKVNDFQFYEFIRDFHEETNRHNPKANITGEENITSILDGQQRLTALYIAMKGSYAEKVPWKRRDNPNAYPKKLFYLNLLSESQEIDLLYDFRFLTLDEAQTKDKNTFWFEVGKVLDFNNLSDVNEFLRDHKLSRNKFAEQALVKLFEIVNKPVINYYLETSQDLDKVLNIFIRVNSGGTRLSYSDMLLSIATAQWETRDAREEITTFVDSLNHKGEGFSIDKDLVMKSCLVLSDISDIAFKVDNFSTKNMENIENQWDDIKKSIALSVDLAASYGYNEKTLTSNNALIPIAYYLKKVNNPDSFVKSLKHREERQKIEKWLRFSLIKRAFSGQPDNVLRPIRNHIRNGRGKFPFEKIVSEFRGTPRALIFTDDDVSNLLYSDYGKAHTFSVLALLYPTLNFSNRWHMDHIFPGSFFTPSQLRKKGISEMDAEFYLENYNYLGNLQLMEGLQNEEKLNTDFEKWLEKSYPSEDERKDFLSRNFMPQNVVLSFSNFKQFLNERNKILFAELKKVLS